MQNIEYLTSKDGKAIAIVIPIDIALFKCMGCKIFVKSLAPRGS